MQIVKSAMEGWSGHTPLFDILPRTALCCKSQVSAYGQYSRQIDSDCPDSALLCLDELWQQELIPGVQPVPAGDRPGAHRQGRRLYGAVNSQRTLRQRATDDDGDSQVALAETCDPAFALLPRNQAYVLRK
jgi:hypothetical protein